MNRDLDFDPVNRVARHFADLAKVFEPISLQAHYLNEAFKAAGAFDGIQAIREAGLFDWLPKAIEIIPCFSPPIMLSTAESRVSVLPALEAPRLPAPHLATLLQIPPKPVWLTGRKKSREHIWIAVLDEMYCIYVGEIWPETGLLPLEVEPYPLCAQAIVQLLSRDQDVNSRRALEVYSQNLPRSVVPKWRASFAAHRGVAS